MPTTSQVHVSLAERSYDIWIGEKILEDAASYLQPLGGSHFIVISDANVVDSHTSVLMQAIKGNGRVDLLEVPSGESSKSLDQAKHLWQSLVSIGADRQSVVLAVGGGVVGDLAGFVASTFARGIRLIQVPTTLLSQVDSSVGGKTAVNLPDTKNIVGAFWQPSLVLIDPATLTTLPANEYASGLAEVVKYGVILDAEFFEFLQQNSEKIQARDPQIISQAIRRSCQLKAEVVQQDEREVSGVRAILNYGHTFAHALEATAGYGALLHGEAVSIGMMCASRLAERMGFVSDALTGQQGRLLEQFDLPIRVELEVSVETVLNAMQRDKKMEVGTLHFVLPTKLGQVQRVSDVPESLVRETLLEFGCG